MRTLKLKQKQREEAVKEAVKELKQGGILVCPSDTVYGLICDAANSKAVARIFKLKKRPGKKPLGLFVKDIKMAEKMAWIDAGQKKILEKYWPGKVTAVLKSKKSLAGIVFKGTVGLRTPDHELVLALLDGIGRPLAQTSANISGSPASTKLKQAIRQFRGLPHGPDLVLDGGDLPFSLPSTVIDLTKEKIMVLRKGEVSF